MSKKLKELLAKRQIDMFLNCQTKPLPIELEQYCKVQAICPLCMTADCLKQMSIEHVPPQSVGGKPRLITCKNCNSKTGHSIEPKLPQFVNYLKYIKGMEGLKLDAYSTDEKGVCFKGTLEITGKRKGNKLSMQQIKHRKGTTPGVDEQKIKELMQNGRAYFPNLKNSSIGLLKAAYLEIFLTIGYRILGNRVFEKIREQIKKSEEKIFTDFKIAIWPKDRREGVHIEIIGEEIISFCVVIELKIDRKKEKIAVFIDDKFCGDIEPNSETKSIFFPKSAFLCTSKTIEGERCRRKTNYPSGRCWQHRGE